MRKIKFTSSKLMMKCHGYAKKREKKIQALIGVVMWCNPLFTFMWVMVASQQPCSDFLNLTLAVINTIFSVIVSLGGAVWKSGHTFWAFFVSAIINFMGVLVHLYKIIYVFLGA